MSSKTGIAKLESELQVEKANMLDLAKRLGDERHVVSTMEEDHQQQLLEMEQRHQEKVFISVEHFSMRFFKAAYEEGYEIFCIVCSFHCLVLLVLSTVGGNCYAGKNNNEK